MDQMIYFKISTTTISILDNKKNFFKLNQKC